LLISVIVTIYALYTRIIETFVRNTTSDWWTLCFISQLSNSSVFKVDTLVEKKTSVWNNWLHVSLLRNTHVTWSTC